jgi:hypothetical protein
MFAKKNISVRREREFEIIKNHVIPVQDIDESLLQETVEYCDILDDPEEAYFKFGIAVDFDWGLAFFEVKRFVEGVKDHLEEMQDEEMAERFEPLLKSLQKYEMYTIHMEN